MSATSPTGPPATAADRPSPTPRRRNHHHTRPGAVLGAPMTTPATPQPPAVPAVTPPAWYTRHEGSPRVLCPALRSGRPESNTNRSNTASAERNVDHGSAFVDAALKRAAARLGIKITHSAPGRP